MPSLQVSDQSLISPVRATLRAHLILLDLITVAMMKKAYKL